MKDKQAHTSPLNIIVIVAALGYFVDIYDLILFQVIKNPSLESLGLKGQELTDAGLNLMSWQMIGMLIGGILWGILGDKKGRLSVLFGSIILYSLANFANAFVTDLNVYAILRLVAGIGLAGELGAGITLVGETMTQKHRGYGTMIVVSFGVLGAVAANLVALNGNLFTEYFFTITGLHFSAWQVAYIIGGILGILLLFLRIGVYESQMYTSLNATNISKGNILKLFSNKTLRIKYLCCIAIGIPIWYMIGILIALAKDISAFKGINNIVTGNAVMFFYIGTSFGDFMSGYLSQIFKSRIKIVFFYLTVTLIAVPMYLYIPFVDPTMFYWICAFLGFAAGYWAVFVTIASEQFGTNIRSTVTTTVPNFVRGSLVPMVIWWKYMTEGMGIIQAAMVVGACVIVLAVIAVFFLEESFGKDLDYLETD